jgi:short-chain fatty acids transporter
LNTYNLIFSSPASCCTGGRSVSEERHGEHSFSGEYYCSFYAMILGMIAGTGLNEKLAQVFSSVTSQNNIAVFVAAYSAGLGVLIPSGGSKWVVEAPYVLEAAIANRVHLGWVVQIYNASESLPNLINPFWMLPLIGILKLRARDLAGYGMLQLFVLLPIVFSLCWLFSQTIAFAPPLK